MRSCTKTWCEDSVAIPASLLLKGLHVGLFFVQALLLASLDTLLYVNHQPDSVYEGMCDQFAIDGAQCDPMHFTVANNKFVLLLHKVTIMCALTTTR
jgi:hypothetical protein